MIYQMKLSLIHLCNKTQKDPIDIRNLKKFILAKSIYFLTNIKKSQFSKIKLKSGLTEQINTNDT